MILMKHICNTYRSNKQDLFNALGSIYSAVMFIGVQNSQTVQPIVDVERTVFYREKAAGMYSPIPYAFAQVNYYPNPHHTHTKLTSTKSLHQAFNLIPTFTS